jgi:serine carboxypeptidase-like clade 1
MITVHGILGCLTNLPCSGDHDPGITHIGTQAWIRHLNLTIVDDWRPWYVGDQVAG